VSKSIEDRLIKIDFLLCAILAKERLIMQGDQETSDALDSINAQLQATATNVAEVVRQLTDLQSQSQAAPTTDLTAKIAAVLADARTIQGELTQKVPAVVVVPPTVIVPPVGPTDPPVAVAPAVQA
jgi:hypothetical protein